jgi:5-methyltetrahydrofolate--homocysteine methyltransferase
MNELKISAIDRAETFRYLGYRGTFPEKAVLTAMDRLEKALLDVITPRYVMRVTDIGNPLFVGEDIREFLSGCDKAVLFCVTLGGETDRLIRYTGIQSPLHELIIDALANAAVEQAADMVQTEIAKAYPTYTQTERYSPGYGDYPLEVQPRILAYLDTKKLIGVSAGESLMMSPLKSITAAIGLKVRT